MLRRRWLDIALMLGTLATAWVTNRSISEWIQRPRPDDFGGFVGRQIDVFSFPSGHVERALAFYGIVLFLTFQTRHRGLWLWLVRITLLAQIVLMPISRTLEGEHWPTDSLAGLLVGGFWLLIGIQVYHWAGRRWPHLVAGDERRVAPSSSARLADDRGR